MEEQPRAALDEASLATQPVGSVGVSSSRVGAGGSIPITHTVRTRLEVAHEFFHAHARDVLDRRQGLRQDVIDRLTQERRIGVGVRVSEEGGQERHRNHEAEPDVEEKLRVQSLAVRGHCHRWGHLQLTDTRGEDRGFDLALFENEDNLETLWDLCYGRRPLKGEQGPRLWSQAVADWDLEVEAQKVKDRMEQGPDGECPDRASQVVLGEIQFANDDYRYVDLLKLLAARQQIDVDLYVYITATGALQEAIATGTVNFDKMRQAVIAFENLIHVPVWLIGLDVPDGFWELPERRRTRARWRRTWTWPRIHQDDRGAASPRMRDRCIHG